MAEFWEQSFRTKKEMWGQRAARSAEVARDFFVDAGLQKILVPGFGYGRNARVLSEAGMQVTGIEISPTAIELARSYFGPETTIYQGSVNEMPFDAQTYEGVYCHALLHLLDKPERQKLIGACYRQLAAEGLMVFTVLAKAAKTYRKGQQLGPDRYELLPGVPLYFYDTTSIAAEFQAAGLLDFELIPEDQMMYLVRCKKEG